jgi:hypothetical protein
MKKVWLVLYLVCHQTAPGYDQLAERHFEFIPLRESCFSHRKSGK